MIAKSPTALPSSGTVEVEKQTSGDILNSPSVFQRAFEIDTVGIIFFDQAGEIVRANDAFLRMGGYTQEDIATHRLRWDTLTPPEWIDASSRAISQLKTFGSTTPYEKQYYRKDGSRFWGLFAAKGLSENQGIEFILDITERKETEARLKQAQERVSHSEAQLRLITDSLPAIINYIDRDLRYVRMNRASQEWWGRAQASIVGRPVEELAGEHFERLRPYLEDALAGHTQNFEISVSNGHEERLFSVVYIPDRGPDGNVRGIVVEAHDITERKRTEEVLRTTEKLAAVGRLASSIAHEINNPLSSVTNLLYLARQTDNVAQIKQYLDIAERELRRVSAISNQTLRFHKQLSKPRLAVCDELFDSVLTIFHGRILNSRISIEKRGSANKAVLCFDNEIRQVLNNLVANAIDAMHPYGGRLVFRSREATEWKSGRRGLMLTVADTGAGMNPQVANKAFQPFFTTKGAGGTGLGLWVSKEIMDRHHGAIRVRSSQKRGRSGTVFTLFLPFNELSVYEAA